MRSNVIAALLLVITIVAALQFNVSFVQAESGQDWKVYYQQAKSALENKRYEFTIDHAQKYLKFLKALSPRRYEDEFIFLSLLREAYTESNQMVQAQQVLDELITYEQHSKDVSDLKSMQASIARQQAEMAFQSGDMESAIRFYKTAIPLYKESYGNQHARVLECLQQLNVCYQKQNNTAYALLSQEEISQFKKSYNPCKDDPAYYDAFITRITKQVRQNWLPAKAPFSYKVKATFQLSQMGEVSNIWITQSGGNAQIDEAAIDAIMRTPFDPSNFPSFCNRKQLPVVMAFDYKPGGMTIRWSPTP